MALASVRRAVAALATALANVDATIFSRRHRRSAAWLELRRLGDEVRAEIGGEEAVLTAVGAADVFAAAAAKRGVSHAAAAALFRRARRRLIFPTLGDRLRRERRAAERTAIYSTAVPAAARGPGSAGGMSQACSATLADDRRAAAAALAATHAEARSAAAARLEKLRAKALRLPVGSVVQPRLDTDVDCTVCGSAAASDAAHGRLYRPFCCLLAPICGGCAASVVSSAAMSSSTTIAVARCPTCRRDIEQLQAIGRDDRGRWGSKSRFVSIGVFATTWTRSATCSQLCCRKVEMSAGGGERGVFDSDDSSADGDSEGKTDGRPCSLCKRDDDHEVLLECSACVTVLSHTYCVLPRLPSVPRGHWLCAGCEVELESRSGATTRVGRALYVRRRTAAFVAAKAGECMRAVSAGRSAQ